MFARVTRIVVALLIVGFSTVWAQTDPLAPSPPPVSFGAAMNTSVGQGTPREVAVGDFNGDGIPDLAVADDGANPNSVDILLGNGDGTFKAATHYQVGT